MSKQNNLFSATPQVLSVADYIALINANLEVLADIAVEGEVSEFKISQQKWVTFRLKDESAEASIECFTVIFKLDQPVEDGMKIRVQGKPRIYPRYGKFSISVENIELVGEGSLKRAFELTKAKLQAEGLFDKARKRSLPEFPERIALITSPDAAAYTDFLKVLRHRFGGLKVYFLPVKVQGKNSIEEITSAFDWLNANYQKHKIQLVVLTRGGGALEDLQAFNSEEVARAIFSSKLPVVCGVGHERDESLADFVADLRASTPSNAAELIVRDRKEVASEIDSLAANLENQLRGYLSAQHTFLEHFFTKGLHFINEKTYEIKQTLLIFANRVKVLDENFRQQQSNIEYLTARLQQNMQNRLSSLRQTVSQQIELLKSYNPTNVLRRGYGIIRDSHGKVVKDAQILTLGEAIQAKVYKGSFSAEVKSLLTAKKPLD